MVRRGGGGFFRAKDCRQSRHKSPPNRVSAKEEGIFEGD